MHIPVRMVEAVQGVVAGVTVALTPAEASTLASLRAGTHVCAPREPTGDMVQVGLEALRTNNVRDSSENGRCVRIYRAMLAAATEEEHHGR